MTHAVALTGQWEGLRAFPRAPRTPEHRKRLEAGLERLGGLYEQMAVRATLLQAGLERLNCLRATMIEELDASETDADLEPSICHPGALPSGSDQLDDLEDDRSDYEPSLCGLGCNFVIGGLGDDLEEQCEDEGGQCDDEGAEDSDREPDNDGEPSLSAVLMTSAGDQSGLRWLGSFEDRDVEYQCEDEGAVSGDDEASLCGIGFGAPRSTGLRVRDLYEQEIGA